MGRRKARSKREGDGSGSKRRRTSALTTKEDEVKEAKGKSTGGGEAAGISKPEEAAVGIVHPLLIPHIIEKIFQHIICPKPVTSEQEEIYRREIEKAESSALAKIVKDLRLVCKQWKESATLLYRRNRVPMIEFGRRWNRGPPWKSPAEKMQSFLDVMKNSNLIPVQRYTIHAELLVKENQQLMKDFMRICGPDTAELKLYWDTSSTMEFTRRSFLDLDLKRLKTLRFDCDWRDDRQTYEIVHFINVLLTAAETLQEFQFDLPTTEKWSQCLIKRFEECTFKRIPKSVKVLGLNNLRSLSLDSLAESELKLEKFQFCGDIGANGRKAICKFFEKQAATLKDLQINTQFDNVSQSSSIFPRFEELLHLELFETTLPQFSWPDTFPKLTSLNVTHWDTESSYVALLTSAKKVSSLKEIHLPFLFLQEPLVKKAAQCFPNISKLHITPPRDTVETLQEVFVHFPNLEELNLIFPYEKDDVFAFNADSVFSGVFEPDCRRIMKAGNFDANIGGVQHLPSMLNLTKLKKLVLEDSQETTVFLSDFSAHFVFLKMASLNELHIFHRYQMSSKYVDLLRKKLRLKLSDDGFSGLNYWDSDIDTTSSDDDDFFDSSSDDDYFFWPGLW